MADKDLKRTGIKTYKYTQRYKNNSMKITYRIMCYGKT